MKAKKRGEGKEILVATLFLNKKKSVGIRKRNFETKKGGG